MKNAFNGLFSRLNSAKERIGKLEDKSLEITSTKNTEKTE